MTDPDALISDLYNSEIFIALSFRQFYHDMLKSAHFSGHHFHKFGKILCFKTLNNMKIMKGICFLIAFCITTSIINGQEKSKFKEGKKFNSEFQKLTSGEFQGTVNGLLIIQNNTHEFNLDFQGAGSKLVIKEDTDEIYDVSFKIYSGLTTSGKTEIEYKTYASSNSIRIKLEDEWFELSSIDGACEDVIANLDYLYKNDFSTEYLILHVKEELILTNWRFLIKKEPKMNTAKVKELKPFEKKIKIMPNSVLVFAIKRD